MARIDGLPQADPTRRPERTVARRTESRRPEGAGPTRSAETARPTDSLELSGDARRAEELHDRLAQRAAEVPDVREDRVAQARARVAAGEYDTENVRRAVADRLMEQLGL